MEKYLSRRRRDGSRWETGRTSRDGSRWETGRTSRDDRFKWETGRSFRFDWDTFVDQNKANSSRLFFANTAHSKRDVILR